MTVLAKRWLSTSASGVISKMAENASRSLPSARNEQTSVVRSRGSMSTRRSTRYTEVLRERASASRAVSGCTKCVTSAMCTPTRKLPLPSASQESASSMSSQPGGSMEQTQTLRKSSRPAMSSGPGRKSSGGRQARTSSEKGSSQTLCSMRMACVSARRSPTLPRASANCARGYSLKRSQTLMVTTTRRFSKSSSSLTSSGRVSSELGKRLSVGTKKRTPSSSSGPSASFALRACTPPTSRFVLRRVMLTTRPAVLPSKVKFCVAARAISMFSASVLPALPTPWRMLRAAVSYSLACVASSRSTTTRSPSTARFSACEPEITISSLPWTTLP
mmetsp:Transcript_76897/g.248862  ORF Transcript_76897/g.248862 Transcript_76897/m.248862 type:complete len:332 (-) Transcript_76897:515-1510(-)